MFLTEKVYIGAEYKNNKIKSEINITRDGKKIELPNSNNLSEMVYKKAYWRKANHIHAWFVDNVQEGVDDCKEYYVSAEQLQELVDICKTIVKIASKTKLIEIEDELKKLLPTKSGFFFGGTDIDEYYVEDCKCTIEQLKNLNARHEYSYISSW